MTVHQPRRFPVVFRLSAVLLGLAALAGGWWQHQPAGSATRLLLRALERRCPAAVGVAAPVTVATGARVLDHVGWALLLDRVAPQRTDRCEGKSKGEQAEGTGG